MSTAGRSRTACGFARAHRATRGRRSATSARSRCASRSTPRGTVGPATGIRATGEARRSWPCSGSARRLLGRQHRHHRTGARTPARRASSRRNHEAEYGRVAKSVTTKPVVSVGRFTDPDRWSTRSAAASATSSARRGRRSPIRSCRARSRRAESTRSASASAATSASRVGRSAAADLLHAEPDGRRGVPPRLASGALPQGSQRRQRRPGRRRRARPAWSARSCSAKRGMRRVHLVDAARELGGHLNWVPRLPGLGEWAAWSTTGGRRSRVSKRRGDPGHAPDAPTTSSTTAPRSSSSRRARTGRATASNGVTQARSPAPMPTLPHVLTPEQVMLEGKARPASASSSTTPTATTWPSASPSCSRGGQQGDATSRRSTRSRPYMRYTLEEPSAVPAPARARGRDRHPQTIVAIEPGRRRRWHALARGGQSNGRRTPWCSSRSAISPTRLYDGPRTRPRRPSTEAGIEGLYRIGDAWRPGHDRQTAIFDGHRLAREIDSDDPASPLPYIRERRLVGATEADYVCRSRPPSRRARTAVGARFRADPDGRFR